MMVAVMDMMFLIGQSSFSAITLPIAPVRTKSHPAAMCDYSTKDASPTHSGSSYSRRKSPCSHGHSDAVRPKTPKTHGDLPETHGDLPIPWPVSRYPWLRASHYFSTFHSLSALHLVFLLFHRGCWSHVLLQIRGVTPGWLRGLPPAAASPTAHRASLDTHVHREAFFSAK